MSLHVTPSGIMFRHVKPLYGVTNSWVSIASIGIGRYGASAFIYNDRIYIVGGQTSRGLTSTVEYIDLSTFDRGYAEYMPEARAFYASGFVNGKFYVIGGIDTGGSPRNEIYEYDPVNDTWNTKTAKLPKGIAYCSSVVFGDKIYVIGGLDSNGDIIGDVYVYDPENDTVEQKSSLNTPRENHACEVLGNKIYCFGGDDGQSLLESIEEYDPSTDTWVLKQVKLPKPLTGIRAVQVVLNNKKYILLMGG